MDYRDVSAGGIGIDDRIRTSQKIMMRLQGRQPTRKSIDVAVGRLRTTDFFTEPALGTAGIECQYLKNEFRLSLRDNSNGRRRPLRIDIKCTDSNLESCLSNELAISQLEKVRQRHIAHVEGGPKGFDQLFLEFFDHSHPVHETSMFFKPSIISYPDSLLEVLRASEQDRRRKEIMCRDLKSGRCSFLEILNRSTLTNMIRAGEHGGFRMYGAEVEQHLVLAHFDNLINQIQRMKGFKLALTDVPLPFLLSTFQITMPTHQDSFTVFFRQHVREHDPDIDCFAIYDEGITRSILDNVVGRVLNDPSTTTDRRVVADTLRETAQRLKQHGPLPP
jgi:hypothetical protein